MTHQTSQTQKAGKLKGNMEEECKSTYKHGMKKTCAYKQGMKKTKLGISGGGGGGIGGIVVWGGALAVATLTAAFTIKISRRRRPTNNHPPTPTNLSRKLKKSNQDEGSEGLRFILQIPSTSIHHPHQSGGSSSDEITTNDSSLLVSTQSLIREDESLLKINGGKETPTCDHQEEDLLSDDNSKTQSEQKDVNKNDSGHDSPLIETIEVNKEDEASETAYAEQIAEEDHPPMQLVIEEEEEDDDDDDDDGEYVVQKGEESSEGTADSSMESNALAIWPAELMEKLLLDFHNSGEKIEKEDSRVKKDDCHDNSGENNHFYDANYNLTGKSMMILNKRETPELVTVNKQPTYSPKMKIWIWSMLVLVLLLLLPTFTYPS